jgi:2-hydroxy-6-oxonona-2,4-dienedioate hydrolase
MVDRPRAWRWSVGRERGWGNGPWLHETIEYPDATWFARISRAGQGGRPPIVMVHGVVVSGAYFEPVAACLAREFDLYIPDLPGTGASRLAGEPWDIATSACRLGEWLDLHGLSNVVLVSNSLGCQVSTMLDVQRPDLVCALVLVGPTMDPEITSVARVMARGVADMPRERITLWKIWIPDLIRSGPLRSLRTLRRGMADPQIERLQHVTCPAIVAAGERDPIVPTRWVRAMAARMPQGRAMIVPGAPHVLNYSRPSELARIVRKASGTWPSVDTE